MRVKINYSALSNSPSKAQNEVFPNPATGFKSIFSAFEGGIRFLACSRVFFFQLFLPGIKRIACTEKRLFPLDRREGNSPQNRNSIRDSRTFLAPWVLTFWPLISLLIINNLSGSPVSNLGIKITTVFLLGLDTEPSKLRRQA
jgi:hypothetical protein